MKIVSWNVNGIRALERKGELEAFIADERPDVLFLQETKARPEQLSEALIGDADYHQFYHAAERKGYSGVGLWVRRDFFPGPVETVMEMPGWTDREGRIIGMKLQDMIMLGIYFPNGGKSDEAWREKLQFFDHFLRWINDMRNDGQNVVWCGDLNVAHNEIDLARPKENEKNIGFLPEERAWVDRVVKQGWVDVFRNLYPNRVSYTWWSMQTRARERNIGWRIDYFFVDKTVLPQVLSTGHYSRQMGSDHCPIWLELLL